MLVDSGRGFFFALFPEKIGGTLGSFLYEKTHLGM
jgi:hypothetical protein